MSAVAWQEKLTSPTSLKYFLFKALFKICRNPNFLKLGVGSCRGPGNKDF